MGSVKLKDLKAYVRYDGSGRVVSGSLVFRKKKPKNGRWGEITKNLCCTDSGSTTTTTTSGGGVTPTAFIKITWGNTYAACVVAGIETLFYSASSTLTAGITVFLDAALTIPLNEGVVIDTGMMSRYVVGVGGVLSSFECTTTTTTTISATTYNLKSGSTQFNVCSGSVNLTLYGNSPSLSIGLQLYTDSGLTTTFTAPYTPFLIGFGSGVNDPVWEVNSTGMIVSQYGAC